MALCEFNCPSLDYVYNMTWAEFRIRLHGWIRKEEREMFKIRELAWVTYIAPHQDPKKLKKSKESFWPLKNHGRSEPKEDIKNAFLEAHKKYLEQRNGKQ